jgi:hypothetical protein
MTKHILIHNPKYNCAASIDVERFAECVRKLEDDPRPLVRWPLSWFDASLLAYGRYGLIEVTPRGSDLLASIDSMPDDPEPEVKITPCSKCNGTGEQPLFVSMETCSRCKGSKTEPRTAADISADYGVKLADSRLDPLQALGRVNREQSARVPVHEIQVTGPSLQEMEEAMKHIWERMANQPPIAFMPFSSYSLGRTW